MVNIVLSLPFLKKSSEASMTNIDHFLLQDKSRDAVILYCYHILPLVPTFLYHGAMCLCMRKSILYLLQLGVLKYN